MKNKLIVTLIQERVADAFHFSTDIAEKAVELDRDILFEMLFAMEDANPSFQLDDIIEEAQKVGMTAEEVWDVAMEVCEGFKSMIVLFEKSPEKLTDDLLEVLLKYIDEGQRAEAKTMLN